MTDLTKDIGSLSPDKRSLLDLLLKEKGAEFNTFPLSFAQQRVWLLDQREPNKAFYNIPSAMRLSGLLDVPILERTLNTIVERHETLRTIFAVINGKPVQVVLPSRPVTLPVVDLSPLPRAEREKEARRRAQEEAQRPFSLTQGPLLRVTLLRLGEEEHVVLFTMHHIISDGWSRGVLIREVRTLYEAFSGGQPSPLPELPIQYADYAVWQREWLQGEALEHELTYWKRQLAGAPATLDLPADHPRPAVQTFRGAQHSLSLSREVSDRLKALSQEEGATLFMTLLAAFQVLLYRYTGQEDLLVGTPIAGRTRAEVEGLIGFFVNTLVLRGRVRGEESFREVLREAREVCIGAYAHQEVPFEKLVEELQPSRELSHHPLFQVMFALQNAGQEKLELPKVTMSSLESNNGSTIFDLTLSMLEVGGEVAGALAYNTDLFEPESVERMAEHFRRLLEAVAADPSRRVSELPLLSEAERNQLLYLWNETEAAYPAESCVHQLFEAQVESSPDAPALRYEDEQMSYAELNRRANQLAHHLRSLGVGPESLVGILLGRSPEVAVSVLAVLKAGGAYVPLDPTYPLERLSFMVEDAGLALLLTDQQLSRRVSPCSTPILRLDTDEQLMARQPDENPGVELSPLNLAYVVYTSGSTGRPKGVTIHHRALVNLALAQVRAFQLRADDRVLQFASLSFDASVSEFFSTWLAGATLCMAKTESLMPGTELLETLRGAAITTVTLPPSVLAVLPAEGLPDLRTMIAAGEACPAEVVAKWRRGGRVVINAYGPSETTVCASSGECEVGEGRPPIGRALNNTQIYILDESLELVPVGVKGELYIGGAGVARGYLRRPELTAERFVPDWLSGARGGRLYRSGDAGRYLGNGKIEFIGRADEQVKLRGYRIELGEVEAVLREHAGIAEAVVVAREEKQEGKRLIAYVVGEAGQKMSVSEACGYLKERLPDYMMPSAFVMLDALPLTPNGKVDRRALPAPDTLRPALDGDYVAARTPVEEALAEIWSKVLNVEQVGVNDNFFELGGHSLLAMQVVSRVCDTFNVTIPFSAIFETPTVAGLARSFVQSQAEQLDDEAASQVLAELEGLSDDQVQLLLDGQESDQNI